MRIILLFILLLINAICVLSGIVYKVTADALNIRSGPGTNYSVVGLLKKNQLIYVTSQSKQWARFYKGYVSRSYLKKATGAVKYVTTTGLNFRVGPSTNKSIITTLNKGTVVNYYGRDPFNKGWGVTNRGYASMTYLKKKGGNGTSGGSSSGSVKTIPAGMGDSFSYMGWQLITDPSSNQYKLRAKYGMKFDSKGFGKINGKYVVAVTTYFGNVGDTLTFYFDNGKQINAVIGDIKNQNDPGCNKYGHNNGQVVLEFVVDRNGGFQGYGGNKTAYTQLPWLLETRVTKVKNTGHLSF